MTKLYKIEAVKIDNEPSEYGFVDYGYEVTVTLVNNGSDLIKNSKELSDRNAKAIKSALKYDDKHE